MQLGKLRVTLFIFFSFSFFSLLFFFFFFYLFSRLERSDFEELLVGMPRISIAAALQICALLAALPAQYYISQWYGTDPAQRLQMTKRWHISPSICYL